MHTIEMLSVMIVSDAVVAVTPASAKLPCDGELGDGNLTFVYVARSGSLWLDDGRSEEHRTEHPLTSLELTLAQDSPIAFRTIEVTKPPWMDGSFDRWEPKKIFHAAFGGEFGASLVKFEGILPSGLALQELCDAISADGSLDPEGGLGPRSRRPNPDRGLTKAPDMITEPGCLMLAGFASLMVLFLTLRTRHTRAEVGDHGDPA